MKKILLLILGKHIRKKVWLSSHNSTDKADELYNWVTNAPIRQWRTRLWCARQSYYDFHVLFNWINGRSVT